MTVYCIYKQHMDANGETLGIDIVETDMNETNAIRFSKLYNLQLPKDMRHVVSFNYFAAKVS